MHLHLSGNLILQLEEEACGMGINLYQMNSIAIQLPPHPSIYSPTGAIYYRHYPLIISLRDLECIRALSHSECASAEDKSRQLPLHPAWRPEKQACKRRATVLWLCHRMVKGTPLEPGLHS